MQRLVLTVLLLCRLSYVFCLVRLTAGPHENEGHVEVFHSGRWGGVCDDDWDIRDATVVCRELGYQSASEASAFAKYRNGSSKATFYWLDNVQCSGKESTLESCPRSNQWGIHNCNPVGENAGAVCSNCANASCSNNGACVTSPSPGAANFTCSCAVGWAGEFCQEDMDECGLGVCQNGANCTNTGGGYTCSCPIGYIGRNCQTNLCDPNPCQHEGECVPESQGYRCACQQGWEGTHCGTASGVVTTCTKSRMRIDIPRGYVGGLPSGYLQLRDPSCNVTGNETFVSISTPLRGCGTRRLVTSNDIIYTNVITNRRVYIQGIATRIQSVRITVQCRYPRVVQAKFNYQPDSRVIEFQDSGTGRLGFEMRLYATSAFRRVYDQGKFPIRVKLGEPLHVGVKVLGGDQGLAVLLQTCRATPSPDPDDTTGFPFVVAGCPVDDTVTLVSSPDVTESRFTIRAFSFITDNEQVFLHCDAIVCNATDPQSRCSQGCVTSANVTQTERMRRSAGYNNHVMNGPIMRSMNEKASEDNSGGVTSSVLLPFALLAITALTGLALTGVVLFLLTGHRRDEGTAG
ncbi:OIT3 [Branchiostoma lanceolatum]|uniref:Soluble scavenger receptor cysteine-rich domain-containing protein SSC5D n=1 Tax=Branchiostoma lanceolatum TaxID=7740 RepID=A0A8J9VSI0_BRALA|nr:OIT3 [Branchiostoma lanceolatum]